jgi:hypothetical protein
VLGGHGTLEHAAGRSAETARQRAERAQKLAEATVSDAARPSATEHPQPDVRLPPTTSDGVDRPREPQDALTGQVVDFTKSGVETFLWKACEVASLHLTPLGPAIVRSLYLSAQLLDSFNGLRDGNGLIFKVCVPGLGDVLPKDFEFVVVVRVASERHGLVSGVGVRAELQVFQPYFPDYDVEAAEGRPVAGRIPAVRTPVAEGQDPWRIWLALIGDGLIRDLSGTLAKAVNVPVANVSQALGDARAVPADIPVWLPR